MGGRVAGARTMLLCLAGIAVVATDQPEGARPKRVAIFGGGISGLTVAHELAVAGFGVDVYEATDRLGGKAVGYHNATGYPVEHSLRIITRGYISFFDMMDRIPADAQSTVVDGTAFDRNLSPLDMAAMTSGKHDHSSVHMHVHVSESEAKTLESATSLLQAPARVAGSAAASVQARAVAVAPESLTSASSAALSAVSTTLHTAAHYASLLPFGVFNPAPWVWDVRPPELLPFFDKILTYAEATPAQRHQMAHNKSFADAIGWDSMSPQMRNYVTRFSGIVVAGRPYSSAHSMFNLWYHFMMAFPTTDRYSTWKASKAFMLNGPTSERLIDPWVHQLTALGVRFHLNSPLAALQTTAGDVSTSNSTPFGTSPRITAAVLRGGEAVTTDSYVLALPLRAVRAITGEAVLDKSFGTGNEWSVGFQFYIRGPVPSALEVGRTVAMVMDSEWQIVYVVQEPGEKMIWKDVALPQGVTAVLSATLSDVHQPGTHGKSFFASTPAECAQEIIAQLGLVGDEAARIAATGQPGPGVRYLPASASQSDEPMRATSELGPVQPNGMQWIAVWPLFIPLPQCDLLNATTPYSNLHLAGEMISTPWFQVPTMEKAVESGKVCAQAVCDAVMGRGAHSVPGMDFPGDWLQ